ncbi:MAG: CpsD/CapB family tyrosine-protein kinase, partial [Acidobacteria bacterium]|nr:CpsD/CapB family tyrosine-protein kinase [Acidobacteriota bacterium]
GLSDYLKGVTEWAPCVLPGLVPGLDILPAGHPPTNPVALLSSSRIKTLITQALADYDHVIIDSPALMLNLADARILADLVDGTIMVIRSGLTPRDFVRRARGQLGNVVGAVLNSINLQSLGYGYSDYYGYGSENIDKAVGDDVTV